MRLRARTKAFAWLALLSAISTEVGAQATPDRLLAPDADPQALAADTTLADADLEALAASGPWEQRARAGLVLAFRKNPTLVADAMTQVPQVTRAGFGKFPTGPVVEPAAMPVVLERIQDPDEGVDVQRALAEVVVKNAGETWRDALLGLLTSHPLPEVRAALVYAFKTAAPEVAAPGIRQALQDPAAAVRAEALRVIGWRADGATFEPAVRAGLTDVDPTVRATAARSAGWLKIAATTELEALVTDADAQVRYEALNALVRTSPALAKSLVASKGLEQDPDARVARVAARAAALP